MFTFEGTPEDRAEIEDIDLSGKTVLVTGSTSGIGRAAARSFGRLGAEVIVHGRDTEAGEAVVEELEGTDGSGWFVSADFQNPEAVSQLATRVIESTSNLDILCNNAGGFFRDLETTSLGVDRTFHINHLAPYQLTAELLDHLRDSGRIVTTASIAHRGADYDQLMTLTGLSPVAAYSRSKLANIQFAAELARRLEKTDREISSNSFHPGIIPGSEFARSVPMFSSDISGLLELSPIVDSVDDGAATLVYLAASPEIESTTGAYFADCREVRPSALARDEDAARELWQHSADILDIEEQLS